MMTFWVAFVICWFASILLIVAFMYGSSERRQCEHLRCLTSPPHYCIDCGMPVSEEQALREDEGGWDSLFEYVCICGHRECTKCGHI